MNTFGMHRMPSPAVPLQPLKALLNASPVLSHHLKRSAVSKHIGK